MFIEAGGELHSVRVANGATTICRLGPIDEVVPQVELLQTMYSMHLSALGRGRERDPATLLQAAAELDDLLFPGGELDAQRVVVCPTASVFDLPWGLLPTLRSAAFVLAPSIGTVDADHGRAITRVVAIAGPSLQHADSEAKSVARVHQRGASLLGDAATADETKRRMRDADLVHLVCHGRFVPGNAMFSSLRLHDGELFVYEVERLRPAPSVVVLSACNAGLHGSPARGQVLGLTTSLLAGGTRSVVAATVPVPDTVATIDLMATFHEYVRDGYDVADALRHARIAHPIVGAAFSCHGRP